MQLSRVRFTVRGLMITVAVTAVLTWITNRRGPFEDETTAMLFTPPGALTVAILVALAVVAILMIPCFLYLRDWRLRVLPGVVALVSATVAVIFGRLVFTGWALYNNGRPPDLGCWTGFVIINAIIAVAAGSPGGLLGLAIGLAIERRRSPKKAQAGRTQKAQE